MSQFKKYMETISEVYKEGKHKAKQYAPGAVIGGGRTSDSLTASIDISIRGIIRDFQNNKIENENEIQKKIENKIDEFEEDMENHILYDPNAKNEYKKAFIDGLKMSIDYLNKQIQKDSQNKNLYKSIIKDIKERLDKETV